MGPGDHRVEADVEKAVVAPDLKGRERGEEEQQPADVAFRNGQNVAVEELLEITGHGVVAADDGEAEGHDRRKEDADDRVRRKGAVALYGHDAETYAYAEERHGEVRIDRKDQPEGHTCEGRMADGVGKEGHAEADDLHAHAGGHRREEDEGQHGLLHEAGLQAIEGKQGNEVVEGRQIRHGVPPCSRRGRRGGS